MSPNSRYRLIRDLCVISLCLVSAWNSSSAAEVWVNAQRYLDFRYVGFDNGEFQALRETGTLYRDGTVEITSSPRWVFFYFPRSAGPLILEEERALRANLGIWTIRERDVNGAPSSFSNLHRKRFNATKISSDVDPQGRGLFLWRVAASGSDALQPPPIVGEISSLSTDVCSNFSLTPSVENGPVKWSARGLPRGLKIDRETGTISGIPTRAGTYAISVRGKNSAGADAESFTLTVNLPPPRITTPPGSLWLKKGELASFSVGASPACGNYNSFQWRSGADRFEPGPFVVEIPKATSNVLNLGPADWDLVGSYQVTVENASGSTSSQEEYLRMYDCLSSSLCVLPSIPDVPASDDFIFNVNAISAGFGVLCTDFAFITQDGFLTLGNAYPLRMYAIPTTLTPLSGESGTSLFGRKFYRTNSDTSGVVVPEEGTFSVGDIWVSEFEYQGIARSQPSQRGIGLIYRFYYVIHKDEPLQTGFSSDLSGAIQASVIIYFNTNESAYLLASNGVETVDWPRSRFEGNSSACSEGLITISPLDQPHTPLDWNFPTEVSDPEKVAFAAQFSMDGKNSAFDLATNLSLFSGPLQVGNVSAQLPIETILSSWYPAADYSDPRGRFNQYLPQALPGTVELNFFSVREEPNLPALFLERPILDAAELRVGFSSTPLRFISLSMMTRGGIPTHYRAGESSDLVNSEWLPWYGSEAGFMLSEGAGNKTVYVQVRNEAGESEVVSASIRLRENQTAPPPPLPKRQDSVGVSVNVDLVSFLGQGEFKVTRLPRGMQYDRENQRITGAPQKGGTYRIKVIHTDPSGKRTVREIETLVSSLNASLTGTFFASIERSESLFGGMGGILELRVSSSGACSGRFTLGGQRHPFRGMLEVQDDGSARIRLQSFDKGKQGYLDALIAVSDTGNLSGSISGAAGSASLSGARSPWSRQTPLPDSWLKKELNLMEWNFAEDTDSLPEGFGLARLSVSRKGKARLAGTLPGGARFRSLSVALEDGTAQIYSSVKPGGDIVGSYDLTGDSEPEGQSTWLQLPSDRTGNPGFGPATIDIWKLDPL